MALYDMYYELQPVKYVLVIKNISGSCCQCTNGQNAHKLHIVPITNTDQWRELNELQ